MKFFNLVLLFMLSLPALADDVPMTIQTSEFGPMAELGAGAIDVPCSYDSHAETCLLDTGSDKSNIQYDSFSETYPVIGMTTGEGLSGDPVTCDEIQVRRYGLGGVILDKPNLVRCEPPAGQAPSSAAQGNIAGLSIFRNRTLHFNFSEKTFSLSDPIPPSLRTFSLAIRPKLGHFGFSVEVSGETVESIVDTGAALTTVDEKFVAVHPEAFTFIEAISGGQDLNGDPVTLNLYLLRSISFGEITLQGIYVLSADFKAIQKFLPNVPVILGFNVISKYNWYFDLRRKLWSLN